MGLFPATLLATAILLDQSVATVGHKVITLSEVRAEARIAFALENRKKPAGELEPEQRDRALQTLISRILIENYLDNMGLVSEVPPQRMGELKMTLKPALNDDIPEKTLERLLTSRIRSEIFAESHLPFRVTVTDEEVRSYYEAEKDRRFLRKPFESVEPIVRADLRRERVRKELEKWLETETRRTQVVLLNR